MAVREGKLVTTKSITDFSIEELEAEIKRKKKVEVPTIINPGMTEKLINGCKEYIDLISQKQPIHDSEHFIFEAAVEAVFSPSIWKWINKNV